VAAQLPEAYQWLLYPSQSSPQSMVEWQAVRLAGQDALAVRASKKLKNNQLLTSYGASLLRMELDRVPLWRGEDIPIRQLVEDYARYFYLPRLKDPAVLVEAIRSGLALLTWAQDSFAFAESYDEAAKRYRGLQYGRQVDIVDEDTPGLLVKPGAARHQIEAESAVLAGPAAQVMGGVPNSSHLATPEASVPEAVPGRPKRFHGTVELDATRVGRDASRIAQEVISHLSALVGARVSVTLDIDAEIPSGAPDHVVRIVTENSRTLKFANQAFEKE